MSEIDQPVYILAVHAPWREILRQRWSGRLDRALVLRDKGGAHHVLGRRNRHGARTGSPLGMLLRGIEEPGAEPMEAMSRPRLLGGYDAAFHVHLGERSQTRGVGLPTAFGTESVDVRVLWWVHDPVQAVRSGTTHGWDVVRNGLDRALHHLEAGQTAEGYGIAAAEMLRSLSPPQRLEASGLTYRVTDVFARESAGELRLGQAGDAGLPYSWTANHREEYEFCLQALRGGPVSLAALWLLRHPDQVSQVLDWTVSHQAALRGEVGWQDEMAQMLGKLTPQEQQELSELLRDRLVALGRQVPGQRAAKADGGIAPPGPGGRPGAAGGWGADGMAERLA
ncbi:hypothetical protein AB0I49_02745 [Streptomyces sp. NPDC050617]|uniref:hypothetical protein n=1 Tax=Streptomyces sp. NPDC050617 TaxID=3154628 RepID=UPI0034219BC9